MSGELHIFVTLYCFKEIKMKVRIRVGVVMCVAAMFMVGCNDKKSDAVEDAINQSFKQMEEATDAAADMVDQEAAKQTLQDVADKLAIQKGKDIKVNDSVVKELQKVAEDKGAESYTIESYASTDDEDYICTIKIGEDYYAVIRKEGQTFSLKDEYGIISGSLN